MSADISNGDDPHDQRDNNDTELRELVYQSLERDGLISRLKAQLRAAVFKTIEKASNSSETINTPVYEGNNGRLCHGLVLDWLEHSRLLYTQDILKVETTGPNYPPALTHMELLEQFNIESTSQSILQTLIDHNYNRMQKMTSLPEHIKQSIDSKFQTEKINDLNRLREHFRSLFSHAFDSTILDAFITKYIPISSTSITKNDYEQICLKWLQACAKVLSSPVTPTSRTNQIITRARRSLSPPSESNSSSTSHSENPRKGAFDFPSPTTIETKKSSDNILSSLINLTNGDDENEDTSSSSLSLFSKRNATSSGLNHLKTIEDIIRDDQTLRTKSKVQHIAINGNKDIPIEYDDDNISQSQMSSIDDITVDKASSSSPSTPMDFLEDF